jgi:hypothetical protein
MTQTLNAEEYTILLDRISRSVANNEIESFKQIFMTCKQNEWISGLTEALICAVSGSQVAFVEFAINNHNYDQTALREALRLARNDEISQLLNANFNSFSPNLDQKFLEVVATGQVEEVQSFISIYQEQISQKAYYTAFNAASNSNAIKLIQALERFCNYESWQEMHPETQELVLQQAQNLQEILIHNNEIVVMGTTSFHDSEAN